MLGQRNSGFDASAGVRVVSLVKEDRALSILPLSHSFELTIELAIFHSGASNVYARSLSPDILLNLLASQGVTCMVIVPQALQLFLNGIERQLRQLKKEQPWATLPRSAAHLPFRLRP